MEKKIGGATIASINITERKLAEEALRKSEKKREENLFRLQKLESLGVLAGGIAHDFNNLLTGIMGNISLALLKKNNPEKLEELLQRVMTATQKATGLTKRFLTFAKGGIPVKKIASISEVIQESVDISLGHSSSIKCEMNLPDDLWLVNMDASQIGQVFQNLIINTRQAMPEGIIKIQAKNVELASGNHYNLKPGAFVNISVEDEGIGIPKENLNKIFDPYFTTEEKNEGGSGLGLAVTHSIVRKHKGYIGAESESGKGTIFNVFLPAKQQ